MKFLLVICFVLSSQFAFAKNPVVIMKTNVGDIELELFQDKAPISVKNFLKYVKSSFYDNLIFHRVINGFMIQGGGFDVKMQHKKPMAPIKNEANNGLKNSVGTIAMARTQVVDSATSQFFINVADNHFLNYQGPNNFGYAVFGKVTKGMSVVNKIKMVRTEAKSAHQNVPVEPVIIKSIKLN